MDDPDQNLKYLGLVGFVELMKSHPRAVVEHRELVLLCLSDDDVTIRTRALELLTGMVTRKTLEDLVLKLLAHVRQADGAYRDELVSRIILVCSRDKYAYLSDFVWYLNVLVQLARLRGAQKHGALLASQLVDITMRVRPVRAFAARDALRLLLDDKLEVGQGLAAVGDVLAAAAWIAGEFASHLLEEEDESDDESDEEEDALPPFPADQPRVTLVDVLTRPGTTRLPARVQAVYLQNTLKVITVLSSEDSDELGPSLTLLEERLDVFLRSPQVEVQERATALKSLLTTLGAWSNAVQCRSHAAALRATVAERMVPVNPKAQARVPKPSGLDLARAFDESTLTAFLDAADPATKPCSFGEADETFDTGFDDDDQFAETGGFYDIKGALAASRRVEAPSLHSNASSPGMMDVGGLFYEFEAVRTDLTEMLRAGSDDESSGEEKKKKKKKDRKKKKKNSSRLNPDHEDPFYIGGGHVRPGDVSVDDVPVVRLSKKDLKADKKSKKKKKSRKVGRADVYVEDSLPDGISDDEKKSKKKKKKLVTVDEDADPDSLDLSQIDLTAPLRKDEVMPQRQHRVVEAAPRAEPDWAAPSKPKKSSKKEKKAKKGKKKRGGDAEEDLLGFGTASPPPPPQPSGDVFDLLGTGDAPPAPPVPQAPSVDVRLSVYHLFMNAPLTITHTIQAF